MASNYGQSCLIASTLSVLLIAGMQISKSFIISSKLTTIFGGFLGSNLFILILTAMGNLENFLFGSSFQTNLFPEAVSCLAIASIISAMVHRVCFTTCIIFSLVALYYMNKISDSIHNYHQKNDTSTYQTKIPASSIKALHQAPAHARSTATSPKTLSPLSPKSVTPREKEGKKAVVNTKGVNTASSAHKPGTTHKPEQKHVSSRKTN